MPTIEELETQVRTNYPQFAWLLTADPDVRQLLLDAVDPDKGFSAPEFEAKFQATNWYRTHADTARQYDAFFNADPASWQRQLAQRTAEIGDLAGQMGLNLSADQSQHVADLAGRYGLSDAEVRNLLVQTSVPTTAPGATPTGSLGTTYNEVRRLARSEYLVPMSDQDSWQWTRWIANGDTTIEGYRAALGDAARGRFPHLADQINQGIPPAAYFAPYRQMIADELEIGSEAVDLLDSKWADILSYAAPGPQAAGQTQAHQDALNAAGRRSSTGAGGVRAMTMSEATRFVRTQPEWERTSRARQMSAGLGNELLRTFGAIA